MRRGRHIKHHRMDDALSGIHRTSLEPRGGNEPPQPRRRSHGCGLAFCCCTRHMCASRLIVTPASYGYAIWYFTRSGTGSFQRDSAGSYRPTQASGFHGWERPNIAGGLSCTAWRSPCFWLLHIGGFRLYTLRRAQPLSMCRHTGAGHSCHRFRLHDRRLASYSSQRLDAPAIWCSVFPPSFAAWRARPSAQFIGWFSAVRHIAHSRGSDCTAATPAM